MGLHRVCGEVPEVLEDVPGFVEVPVITEHGSGVLESFSRGSQIPRILEEIGILTTVDQLIQTNSCSDGSFCSNHLKHLSKKTKTAGALKETFNKSELILTRQQKQMLNFIFIFIPQSSVYVHLIMYTKIIIETWNEKAKYKI